MSGIGYTPPASAADVSAIKAQIPQAATTTPQQEKTGGDVGVADSRYARADHQHPRLTSTTYATLDIMGKATAMFSRSFVYKPGLNLTETDATEGSQPLVLRGLGWIKDATGLFTGVTIQGSRAQLLPNITPVSTSLIAIATTIAAVNSNVVTPLTNYNVFGGTAFGATVSVIAVARSDVSSS